MMRPGQSNMAVEVPENCLEIFIKIEKGKKSPLKKEEEEGLEVIFLKWNRT